MKVLIIGSNGLIASAVGRYCHAHHHSVDVVGRSRPLLYPCDRYAIADLLRTKPSELDGIDLKQYDLIVYAAGAGVQSYLRENPDQIYALNVAFPIGLLSHLKKINYMGTAVTFGSYFEIGENSQHKEWTEEEILSSLRHVPNDYCVSKRILTRFASSCDVDFKYYHFILPTVYAEYESSNRLIPYTISAVRSGTKGQYTSGEQTRQYVHADDVANVIFKMIASCAPSGTYNMPAGDTMTVKDIVETIYRVMNTPMPNGLFGTTSRDDSGMTDLRIDCTKISKVLMRGGNSTISRSVSQTFTVVNNTTSPKENK